MKSFYLVVLFFGLSILFFSCKSSENQVATPVALEEQKQSSSYPNLQQAPEPTKIERSVVEQAKQEILADTLFASIERTACYGRCPIYKALIYNSGYVLYKGVLNVEKIGIFSSRLSPSQIQEIKNKVAEVHFFDLESQYDSPVTDLPSTFTFVKIGIVRKKIKNRVGGPQPLKQYESYLENLVNTLSWSKKSDSNQ